MSASDTITEYIAKHNDWRGKKLARIRQLVLEAEPRLVEEWKWSSPGWSHGGLVCAATAFKEHVHVNFFKGASLKDAKSILNAGQDAKGMRSIKLKEGDALDEAAFKDLVREAVKVNEALASEKAAARTRAKA